MQVPSHGQWWSRRSMQQPQSEQWIVLGGLQISQDPQYFILVSLPFTTSKYLFRVWSNMLSIGFLKAIRRNSRDGRVAGSLPAVMNSRAEAITCKIIPIIRTIMQAFYLLIKSLTVFAKNTPCKILTRTNVKIGCHKLIPN